LHRALAQRFILFSLLGIASASATAALWSFQPGVTVRGKKPETWVLDLRNQPL